MSENGVLIGGSAPYPILEQQGEQGAFHVNAVPPTGIRHHVRTRLLAFRPLLRAQQSAWAVHGLSRRRESRAG